jgi:hypothetical protein
MHSRSNWPPLAAGIFLIWPVAVQALEPLPPLPTPTPTAPPLILVDPLPTPSVNPDESIPVVISYGQNQETRARVYRGVMDPVGMRPNQIVTVTLLLPKSVAGMDVALGLYDGGQIGQAAVPNTSIIALTALLHAAADGTVQFNFQAGQTLGLYRLQLTVGPFQSLLQFYVGRPRSTSGPTPLPSPSVNPPPLPTPSPIK